MTTTLDRPARSSQAPVPLAEGTALLPPVVEKNNPPKTVALLWAGGLALTGLLSGTATTAPIIPPSARYIGEWTSTARMIGTDPSIVSAPLTQAEEIQWLHEASGLTWQQLGRMFGVSRRAVHLWANGGRMNGTNAELLGRFAGLVRALPANNPDERRAALLDSTAQGPSLVDQFRARHHVAPYDNIGNPFSPEELLGALHDEPEGASLST